VRQVAVQSAAGGRTPAVSAESNLSQTSSAPSPRASKGGRKWLALGWLSRSLGGGAKPTITSFDVEEVGTLRETYTPGTSRSLDAGATAGDAPGVTGLEADPTGGSTSSTSRRLMLTPAQAAVTAGNTGGSGTSSSSRPVTRSPGSDTVKRSNRLAAAAAAGASAAALLGHLPRTSSASNTAADSTAAGAGLSDPGALRTSGNLLQPGGNLPAGGGSFVRPTIQPPQDSPVRAHLLTPTASQSTPASGQHRYSPQLTGSSADDEDSEGEVDQAVSSSSHHLRLFGGPSAAAAGAAGGGSSRGRSDRDGTSNTEEALAVQYAMMLDDQEPGQGQGQGEGQTSSQSQTFGQQLLRPAAVQGRQPPQQQLPDAAGQPQRSDTSPVRPRVLTTAGQTRLTRPILVGPAPVLVPRSPAGRRDTTAPATSAAPQAAAAPAAAGCATGSGGASTAGTAGAATTTSFQIDVDSSEEEGSSRSSWGDDQVRRGGVGEREQGRCQEAGVG
jgi:hypothetical protein